MKRNWARSALWWAAVASAVPAMANDFNYHTPLIGERAVGMGGAATGVSDDASASYYNPAGLAQTRMTSLSLSATVVQFRWQSIDEFLGPEGIDQWTIDIIAASWSWATDLWGGRFALSLYVPDASDFDLDTTLVTDVALGDRRLVGAHLIRRADTETFLGGASLAWALNDRWALGFTLFGKYTTSNLLEDNTYQFSDGSVTQVVDTESADLVGARVHLGVLYRPSDTIQLGLTGRLGVHLAEWGDRRRLRFQSTAADPDSFTRVTEDEHLGITVPGDENKDDDVTLTDVQGLAFGLSWHVSPDVLLAADVSWWSPVKFQRRGRVIEKQSTWNAAIGGEVRVAPQWPMRFGLFTNLSAAPDIDPAVLAAIDPTTATRLDLPPSKVHFFGGAVSLGNVTSSSTLDVAMVFQIGLGDRVELLETGATRHDILDWALSLTLSGSYIFAGDAVEEDHLQQQLLDLRREVDRQRQQQEIDLQEEQQRRKLREEPSPWQQQRPDSGAAPPGATSSDAPPRVVPSADSDNPWREVERSEPEQG
jgi:long-chain fatty acid transport protein